MKTRELANETKTKLKHLNKLYYMKKLFVLALSVVCLTTGKIAAQEEQPVDYVNILMGTQSKHSLSAGNTYPAIARPWGMNFGRLKQE